MRVGSEWHLLSSSRLEQAVYEHHPIVTTQMLTQMLIATVSLCVLCEATVRPRPCAQLLPQHCHVHARAQPSAKSAEAWPKVHITGECSFRLFKGCSTPLSRRFRVEWST